MLKCSNFENWLLTGDHALLLPPTIIVRQGTDEFIDKMQINFFKIKSLPAISIKWASTNYPPIVH